MPDLFGLDIATIINDEIEKAGGVLDGTLIQDTPGSRTPGSLTAGTNPTSTSHSFKGFFEQRTKTRREGTLVQEQGLFVTILGASLSVVPKPGDRITIESATYEIVGIPQRDPAAATYVCRVE